MDLVTSDAKVKVRWFFSRRKMTIENSKRREGFYDRLVRWRAARAAAAAPHLGFPGFVRFRRRAAASRSVFAKQDAFTIIH